jgi:predicted anti-sigma-YlaC factor YlaD
MRCPFLEGLIPSYCEGTLAERDRARVEEHLLVCGECRHALRVLGDLERDLPALLRKPYPPPDFDSKLRLRIAEEERMEEARMQGLTSMVVPLLDACAYAVLTLVICWVSWHRGFQPVHVLLALGSLAFSFPSIVRRGLSW